MNKVLILGHSNIVKKRVIPALSSIKSINCIQIASKSSNKDSCPKVDHFFNSYDDALNNFDGDLVYISLPNYLHDEYLLKSIEKGFHCVIDKPAIIKKETIDYLDRKDTDNIAIAESVVFMFHPAWSKLIKELNGPNKINKVIGNFLIPELDKNNFRMSNKLGGGCLNDMSAYAMGMGRWLWNESPINISVGDVEEKDDLIKSFSFIAKYPKNKITMGSFGFGYEYLNKVSMFSKESWGEIDRVFSIPQDIEIDINGRKNNSNWKKKILNADSFKIFFEEFLNDINSNNQGKWYKNLKKTFSDYEKLSKAIYDWRE